MMETTKWAKKGMDPNNTRYKTSIQSDKIEKTRTSTCYKALVKVYLTI